jgi:hypothetical protein
LGYEIREYLLEKWGRKCAYCGKENVPIEVEHIQPKSKGGTNRISNLTLACRECNEKKGNQDVQEFLKKKPELSKSILRCAKAPLTDAAAVNATRYACGNAIKSLGLPSTFWSGGRTKKNRISQGYAKASKESLTDFAGNCIAQTAIRTNFENTLSNKKERSFIFLRRRLYSSLAIICKCS